MRMKAYTPLAKFGRVYYIPTPKGFMFYDRRTKTAMLDSHFINIIYEDYRRTIKPRTEWELPTNEIQIKKWACNTINTDDVQEKHEKEVFELMGYHYVELGRPKNFWSGLLNLDPRFEHYTIPEFKIDTRGSYFPPSIPRSIDEMIKIIRRIKGQHLTEKLIFTPDKKPQVSKK